MAAARALGSTAVPTASRSETATSRAGSGRAAVSVLQFTPMPTTAYSSMPLSASAASSVRMPQTFRLPMTRSFVHLMPTSAGQQSRMARRMATATAAVSHSSSAASRCGRSRTERYTPPGGETNVRPRLPRPPVWRPVT